jgi:hypothetical protein
MRESGLTLDRFERPRALTMPANHGGIGSVITQGNTMNPRCLRLLCAGALALSPLLAQAQYSWVDDKGTRVFSDRPPPPGTPAARILRTPHGMEPAPTAAPLPAALPGAVTAAPETVPEWKQREEDYKRRSALRATDEEKEKQAARYLQQSAHDVRCARTREAHAELEALERARFQFWKKTSEREQLPDVENRQRELLRLRAMLSSCVSG